MVEAIWGEHKTSEQIAAILKKVRAAGELALVTRVEPSKAVELERLIEDIQFHEIAKCVTLGAPERLHQSGR